MSDTRKELEKALANNIISESEYIQYLRKNAGFSLRKFYALSKIIWEYDIKTYVKLREQTQECRNELSEKWKENYNE